MLPTADILHRMKDTSVDTRRESRFVALLVLAGVAGLSLSVGLPGLSSLLQ
jgi:hypothetical protein